MLRKNKLETVRSLDVPTIQVNLYVSTVLPMNAAKVSQDAIPVGAEGVTCG